MKKKIMIIFSVRPTQIYLDKFDLEKLSKNFYLSCIYIKNIKNENLTCYEIDKKYKIINKKYKLFDILKIKEPDYIMTISHFQKQKNKIFEECKKILSVKLIDYEMNSSCYIQTNNHLSLVLLNEIRKNFVKNFDYILIIILKILFLNLRIFLKKQNSFKVNFFFYSGNFFQLKNNFIYFRKINFIPNSKKFLNVPSFDSIRLNRVKQIVKLKKKKFILFQDEMLIEHQDLRILNEKKPENFNYYRKLRNFFSFLEKKLKLDVVIALHPRANFKKSSNLFGNRLCRISETPELVYKSEFICMHASSSSISFPVLLRKKILIINSDNILKNFNYRFRFHILQTYLNLKQINLDHKKLFENEINHFMSYKIDENLYEKYEKKFLGPKDPLIKNFSDILSKYIR